MTTLDFYALLEVRLPPGPKHGCKKNRGMRVMLKKRTGAHDWWAQPVRQRQDDKHFLKLARRDHAAAKQYLSKLMSDSIRDRLDEASFIRSVMPVIPRMTEQATQNLFQGVIREALTEENE